MKIVGRLILSFTLAMLTLPVAAQSETPPSLLPPNIRTQPNPVSPVVRTGNPGTVTTIPAAPTPISRFEKDPRSWPIHTMQAVYSLRSSSAWLIRMQQADGRFLGGLNSALARPLDGIGELSMSYATRSVVLAANYTGEEKLTACANQAILAMLTLTKTDPTDSGCKVPNVSANQGPVGFAALLALAIFESNQVDQKMIAEAHALCNYIRKQVQADGSIAIPTEVSKSDPYLAQLMPGWCLQALMHSHRLQPEGWKSQTCDQALMYYRKSLATQSSVLLASSLMPAAVDFASRAKTESDKQLPFDFADMIAQAQFTFTDAPSRRWVGGFRTGSHEPSAHSAECSLALLAAMKHAANVPDALRHQKYRTAGLGGLEFMRSLQLNDDNCMHFEKTFRVKFLLGGVTNSPVDGNLRIDHAAMFTIAHIRFLESGAEKGE